MMEKIVGALISLLVMVVILYLGPGIGESISDALPICETGDFASATTGADVWTSNVAIVSVVILIVIVSYAITSLKGLRGKE